jgi:hypothetical protein
MKIRILWAALALAALTVACSNDSELDEQQPANPENSDNRVAVTFGGPSVDLLITRATDTAFSDGDKMGIYAVNRTMAGTDSLKPSGNYADNFCFLSNGDYFISQNNDTIWQHKSNPLDLIYYAVYPYSASLGSVFTSFDKAEFTFSTRADQSTYVNYAASDLCMQKLASKDMNVELNLKHMMTCIEVVLTGSYLDDHNISVSLTGLRTQVNVDMNKQTVMTNSMLLPSSTEIKCYEYVPTTATSRKFRALVAPQAIDQDADIIKIYIDDVPNGVSINEAVEISKLYSTQKDASFVNALLGTYVRSLK